MKCNSEQLEEFAVIQSTKSMQQAVISRSEEQRFFENPHQLFFDVCHLQRSRTFRSHGCHSPEGFAQARCEIQQKNNQIN